MQGAEPREDDMGEVSEYYQEMEEDQRFARRARLSPEEVLNTIEIGGAWRTKGGEPVRVKEMDYSHLVNLKAWLERSSARFHAVKVEVLVERVRQFPPKVREVWEDQLEEHILASRTEWIKETVLYRAVDAEIRFREELALNKGRLTRKKAKPVKATRSRASRNERPIWQGSSDAQARWAEDEYWASLQ